MNLIPSKNFLLAVILSLSTVGFAGIRVVLVEKETGTFLRNYNAFLIDPVDSAVLGYERSNTEGECDFSLSRPLKGTYFQIKVFGLNIQDTVFLFNHQNDQLSTVLVSNRKRQRVATIYYNESGIADYSSGIALDDFWACSKNYNATRDACLRFEKARLLDEFTKATADWKKEMEWVDSMSAIYPDEAFPVPAAPAENIVEWAIYDFITIQMEPAGGWNYFLNKLFKLKALERYWQKKQTLRIDFSFSEGRPQLIDSLAIFNSQNHYLKRSEQVWNEFQQVNDHTWQPLEINGHKNDFQHGFYYNIDFIYRNG